MKHCPTCNHEIKDQVRFCPFCGSAADTVRIDPVIGSVFAGEFVIERVMREGDSTTLLAATQLVTNTKVILSLLPRGLINEIGEESLARHLGAAARLHNPGVAAIREVRVVNTATPFIVLEHFEGVSLAERLKEGRLEPKQAVQIINQIAWALREAQLRHAPYWVPSLDSVWLIKERSELHVKIAGLDVSRILADEDSPSDLDLSRLQNKSRKSLTGLDRSSSSDVFILGVIAYELIAGEPPFQGVNQLELPAIGAKPKPLPASIVSASALNAVFERALNPNPEARQPTVTTLAKELEHVVERARSVTCARCGCEILLTAIYCRRCGLAQSSANERKLFYLVDVVKNQGREPRSWIVGSEIPGRGDLPETQDEAKTDNEMTQGLNRDSAVNTGSLDPGRNKHVPTAGREKSIYYDENVQFTVYRPRVIKPLVWNTMLVFAHLSEKRPDADAQAPDPIQEVQRQARQVLGDEIRQYQETAQDSAQAVPREGEITFLPTVPGIEFNPPSRTFLWEEDVHKEEFRLRASPQLDQQTARGRLSVFLGSILLAEVTLSIRVDSNQSVEPQLETSTAQAYRKIFASYSHKDIAIVEQFEHYARAFGDRYLRDVNDLRAGELWSDTLGTLISEANVFQLFWSSNSMKSEFVRQEWEFALGLGRGNFIRPTYWENPLPAWPEKNLPPEELVKLHFQKIAPAVASPTKHFNDDSGVSQNVPPDGGVSDYADRLISPGLKLSVGVPRKELPTTGERDTAEKAGPSSSAFRSYPILAPERENSQSKPWPTMPSASQPPMGARLSSSGNVRDTISSGPQFPQYAPMTQPPPPRSRTTVAIFVALGCLGLVAFALFVLFFVLRVF
jgi:hypothetical protein